MAVSRPLRPNVSHCFFSVCLSNWWCFTDFAIGNHRKSSWISPAFGQLFVTQPPQKDKSLKHNNIIRTQKSQAPNIPKKSPCLWTRNPQPYLFHGSNFTTSETEFNLWQHPPTLVKPWLCWPCWEAWKQPGGRGRYNSNSLSCLEIEGNGTCLYEVGKKRPREWGGQHWVQFVWSC